MAFAPPAPAASPSLVDTLFQRSLDDLIKSLRADQSAAGESVAVARALSEIQREIRAADATTKAVALQKLTYLSSLHFASIASHSLAFPAIELLASPHLPHKRIAYLAASLLLHPASLSLLPLATHQLHKDLSPSASSAAAHRHVSALALQLLASPPAASAPDLAVHLAHDLVPHLSRGCPRAIAAATRVIATSPSTTVPVLFKPLAACLASPDPRASTAAAAAFCDLSAPPADAASFLPLAPDLYSLLTTSRSNWALIKVLKVFARLAPLESRLAARIVDPVRELLSRSAAMSLTFECIRTVLTALPAHEAAVRLAIGKAKDFLAAEDDPNLRYLGLLALGMLGPAYASTVHDCRDVIAQSLGDADLNIRREALHLMMGMIDGNNVMDITGILVTHAAKSDPEFANEILGAVLAACGHNIYELVVDFDWYASLLADMARSLHCAQGDEIGRQLVDVGLRVHDARPELIRSARSLLIDPALLGNHFLSPVLSAAAWISGEYVDLSKDPVELIEALLQPRTSLLPMSVRAVYIHAVFKVITFCFSVYVQRLDNLSEAVDAAFDMVDVDQTDSEERKVAFVSSEEQGNGPVPAEKGPFSHVSILYMINLIQTNVSPLVDCNEIEVKERARNLLGFIHLAIGIQEIKERQLTDDDKHSSVKEHVKTLRTIFCQELGPVSATAQKKVAPQNGLVLENLAELTDIVSEDDTTPSASILFHPRSHHSVETRDEPAVSVGSSSLSDHRKRHGLFYLPTENAEDERNDYPRANDSLRSSSHETSIDDKLKTVEPIVAEKKIKSTKSRPKVVKLDGEDFLRSMVPNVNVTKQDPLSGAVRGVLLSRDAKPSSSKNVPGIMLEGTLSKLGTNESSSRLMENRDSDLEGHPSSFRTDMQSHKEKDIDLPESDVKQSKKHSSSSRRGHRQGKHKHRERSTMQPDIVPQAPIIGTMLYVLVITAVSYKSYHINSYVSPIRRLFSYHCSSVAVHSSPSVTNGMVGHSLSYPFARAAAQHTTVPLATPRHATIVGIRSIHFVPSPAHIAPRSWRISALALLMVVLPLADISVLDVLVLTTSCGALPNDLLCWRLRVTPVPMPGDDLKRRCLQARSLLVPSQKQYCSSLQWFGDKLSFLLGTCYISFSSLLLCLAIVIWLCFVIHGPMGHTTAAYDSTFFWFSR